MPQPKYPLLFHLGKLVGLATGLLVDFGTMPFAGLALGYIVDTVIYNLWVGSDRPRRVRIPALAVIIAGATACAYSVLFLYAAGPDSGIWHMFDRVADGMAMVIPAVDAVSRAAHSAGADEAAGAFRVAFAAGWIAAAALMLISSAAATFPAQHRACQTILMHHSGHGKKLGASFIAGALLLLFLCFSSAPYEQTMYYRHGLLYIGKINSFKSISVVSIAAIALPMSVYLLACSLTFFSFREPIDQGLS